MNHTPSPRYLIARFVGGIVGVAGLAVMVYLFDRPKAPAGAVAMAAAAAVAGVVVVAVTWVGAQILAAQASNRTEAIAYDAAQEEWHSQQYQALSGQLSTIVGKQTTVVAWARHRAAAMAAELAQIRARQTQFGDDAAAIRQAQEALRHVVDELRAGQADDSATLTIARQAVEVMRRDMDRLLVQYVSMQDVAEQAKLQMADVLRDLAARQTDLEEDFARMRQRSINGTEPRLKLLPGEPS